MKFVKYTIIGVITTILHTISIWFFREKLDISLIIINPLIILVIFILKYSAFDRYVWNQEKRKKQRCLNCHNLTLNDYEGCCSIKCWMHYYLI